jgi:hypothetical protein
VTIIHANIERIRVDKEKDIQGMILPLLQRERAANAIVDSKKRGQS